MHPGTEGHARDTFQGGHFQATDQPDIRASFYRPTLVNLRTSVNRMHLTEEEAAPYLEEEQHVGCWECKGGEDMLVEERGARRNKAVKQLCREGRGGRIASARCITAIHVLRCDQQLRFCDTMTCTSTTLG
eukprot:1159001-Pelagomonas_calceolata.AAC.7